MNVSEPVTPQKSSAVQYANQSILLIVLLAGTIFGLFFTELGMSNAIASFLDAVVVLISLQLLLRNTDYSPAKVLNRYRNVSLSTAIGLTSLMLITSEGLLTFASAFIPRLHSILALANLTTNSVWELVFLSLGAIVLAPFYEEIVFRGVALRAYRDARTTLFAVLFTSTVFSFVHGSVVHGLAIFPASIIFALVVLRTGQLWTAIVAHALYNFVVIMLTQFDVPTLPATPAFGIFGLVIAGAAFWLGVRWLGLPKTEEQGQEKRSIRTMSLTVALILIVLLNLLTTYGALFLDLESML